MKLNDDRAGRLILGLRQQGVTDPRVLTAMESVDRAVFVHEKFLDQAWEDQALPIDCAQTISQPYIVGLMTQALDVQPRHRVLEIGTGSGYLCALLALRARKVLSLEVHADLALMSQRHLDQAGIANAQVRVQDGAMGAASEGPFDAILLGGSVSEVPQVLLDQLALGGRLIAIVGEEPVMQTTLFTRVGPQSWHTKVLWDTLAPPLQGFAQPSAFHF